MSMTKIKLFSVTSVNFGFILNRTENDSVAFKEYFCEFDDELNERLYSFEDEVMEEDSTDDSGRVFI